MKQLFCLLSFEDEEQKEKVNISSASGLATHDIVKYITDNVISEFIGSSCKNLVQGKMESHIFKMTSEERS